MALPIRLIVGPDNIMEIPLEAQSVDITVNRNASAFPTPNNIVGRVAIDTNIPEIDIEISGIFQDDDSATFDIETTTPHFGGGDIVFNFASAVPTSNLALFSDISKGDRYGGSFSYYNVVFKDDFSISDEKTGLIDINNIGFTDVQTTGINGYMFLEDVSRTFRDTSKSTINHPSSGTYVANSTSIVVHTGSTYTVNTRVHLADGTYVGFITGISSNTLSFAAGTKVALAHGVVLERKYRATLYASNGQVIGSLVDAQTVNNPYEMTHIGLDQINVPIYENFNYYLVLDSDDSSYSAPPTEQILNNKRISLYPNFWRIDNKVLRVSSTIASLWGGGPQTEPMAVHLDFSNEMAHADYQNKTSGGNQIVGAYPTIVSEGDHHPQYDGDDRIAGEGEHVRVKVPIGGITTHAVNGNPASTLALIVKKALELTTDVMDEGYITSSDGETLASAFEAVVSGPMLKVKQRDRPINANLLSTIEPCLQHDASEEYEVNSSRSKAPAQIEFFTDSYALNSVSVSAKSAGDKVQDLLGIVSNAKKNRDLIRGIQIPYDSLIQSDAVTPTARNFFLTFGQQDNDAKGSSGNTLSASHHMMPQLLPGDLGGETSPDDESSFFDNFGEFGDAVQALGNFVGNFISDTFVTLLTDPHGNDGGIRIIPEKFHVHYDAGNKYYAYKLILKASDFVIGV